MNETLGLYADEEEEEHALGISESVGQDAEGEGPNLDGAAGF